MYGSVAERVTQQAHRPVYVVRAEDRERLGAQMAG
jgi:hypothetical protein